MEFPVHLEVGSRIVFDQIRTSWVDITLGRTYTIAGIDSDGEAYFLDDVEEPNYACWSYEFFHTVE